MKNPPTLLLLFILFFLSGFAGLVYQIVWIRMAFSCFGVITPVLSVVVSVFMLGIGLGSVASGKVVSVWKTRIRRSPLELYALTEFLIGATAVLVPFWLIWGRQVLIQAGDINSLAHLIGSAAILVVALFPSCFFMGATIPIVMGFLEESVEWRSGSFSLLYSANVLGAVCGSTFTALVLIETLGFRSTLWVAVMINLGLALIGRHLARAIPHVTPTNSEDVPRTSEATFRFAPFSRSFMILLATGFISMANEILWTRNFTSILGTTIYAFALIVGIYLAATAVGSLLYRWQYRHRRSLIPIEVLLMSAGITLLFPILLNDVRLHAGFQGVVVGIFPFCAIIGYLTPMLVDRVSGGRPEAAGKAYMINAAGCVLGPLITSYGLLPFVGVRLAVLMLSVPLVLLALPGLLQKLQRDAVGLLTLYGICAGLCAGVCNSYEERSVRFQGSQVLRRDYAATVISVGEGLHKRLLVNGVGMAYLTPITKTMAHLPALAIKGGPRNALLICFGMGTTFRSLLSWSIPTTAVELVPSVLSAFPDFYAQAENVLKNPMGRIVIDDGRRFLNRSAQRYDVITLDPPPPVEAAGSGLLYSKEFYEEVKQHLTPQGVLQQWWPGGERRILAAVARTLQDSFPYVRCYKGVEGYGFHFLAAMHPIVLPSAEAIGQKMPPAARADLLEWSAVGSIEDRAKQMVAIELPVPLLASLGDGSLLTDDHPYNEYYFIRRTLGSSSPSAYPEYVQ